VAIYVVLGLFVWRQVREARKLREEQARPFVIVDFDPGFLVYLTVENLGRTIARDISIQGIPGPVEHPATRPGSRAAVIRRHQNPAPGHGPPRCQRQPSTPMKIRVSAGYFFQAMSQTCTLPPVPS
jgi:hypothetical protein